MECEVKKNATFEGKDAVFEYHKLSLTEKSLQFFLNIAQNEFCS